MVYKTKFGTDAPILYYIFNCADSACEIKLSWSHYLVLMRVNDINERNFYEIETLSNNWSLRELDRQINSSLFERHSLSKENTSVVKLAQRGQIIETASDLIKDPYILEFLNLPESSSYNETELEEDDAVKALIKTMESYTNGGLILIQEKLEENPNYFLQPTSFLNMILESDKLQSILNV